MQALVNVLEILQVAVSNWSPETFRQTQWSGVRNALVDVGRSDLAELVDVVVKCMSKPAQAPAAPPIAAAELLNISSFEAVVEVRPWGKPERAIAEVFGKQFVLLATVDTASTAPGATASMATATKPAQLSVADTLLARSGMPGEPAPVPAPRRRVRADLPEDVHDSIDSDDLDGFAVISQYVKPSSARALTSQA